MYTVVLSVVHFTGNSWGLASTHINVVKGFCCGDPTRYHQNKAKAVARQYVSVRRTSTTVCPALSRKRPNMARLLSFTMVRMASPTSRRLSTPCAQKIQNTHRSPRDVSRTLKSRRIVYDLIFVPQKLLANTHDGSGDVTAYKADT